MVKIPLSRFLLMLLMPTTSCSLSTENILVKTNKVVQEIGDMFVGFTLDTYLLRVGWGRFNFSSPKALNLMKAVAPSYIRVGGSMGEDLVFDPHAGPVAHIPPIGKPFKLTATRWDELNEFIHNAGLKLIFAFNAFQRKNDVWDPTNAELLMNYSSQKHYDIAGWELGNEPDLYVRNGRENITGAMMGADFTVLRQILEKSQYKSSLLLGPDMTPLDGYRDPLMREFLSHGGASAVDVVTIHHYYFNGHTAQESSFVSLWWLNKLASRMIHAVDLIDDYQPVRPLWLGETSTGWSGGALHLSDAYAAGFLWMDKLGVCARYGIKGVLRQSLYGGNYGVLQSDMDPNPDYWLTLLYKRLVGNKVFDVTSPSKFVRVYAHCTKLQNLYHYNPGSVTVYAMNVNNDSAILRFPHLPGQDHLDVFWLTPQHGSLRAKVVELNGQAIVYANNVIPPLPPKTVTSGSVTIPPRSFGFIVMPHANLASCKSQSHGPVIG
ncbi:heparanase-like [Haliotis cracherodii]|uniref:heparanase-like n=1 Tax=Haliotis cracherodii TaxID=6455 RepID=UPI0039ED9775